MKRLLLSILAFLPLLLAGTAFGAEPLSEKDTAFLAGYERVRSALAADRLDAAKAAAGDLDGGAALAAAKSIGAARKAFKALSARAVALARGRSGFFIARCTMYPGGADWVQTVPEVSNPYWGKAMLRCGEIAEQK